MNQDFPKPQGGSPSLPGVTNENASDPQVVSPLSSVHKPGRGRPPGDFWGRVDKNGPIVREELGPCWLWTGAKTRDGYGRFTYRSREMLAHRVSFLMHIGAVDAVEAVMHKCDTRACVNPRHLEQGTRALNNADCKAKGRQTRGERNGCSRLTAEQVEDMRFRFRNGDSRYSLAERFGVSHRQVCYVVRGERWK